MSLPTTSNIPIYKVEDGTLTIYSDSGIPLDESITQFIIQKSELDSTLPSTSHDINYLTIKQEQEVILPDLNLVIPQEVITTDEVQEVVEEASVYAYEITRNERGELECPVCNANFKIIANLERHIQIHAKKFVFEIPKGNNPPKVVDGPPKLALYSCELCGQAFEYKRHLSRHTQSEHRATLQDEGEVFKCKECPAILKSEKSLKNHEQAIHMNKCEKCKKVFKTKNALKLHLTKAHNSVVVVAGGATGSGTIKKQKN